MSNLDVWVYSATVLDAKGHSLILMHILRLSFLKPMKVSVLTRGEHETSRTYETSYLLRDAP